MSMHSCKDIDSLRREIRVMRQVQSRPPEYHAMTPMAPSPVFASPARSACVGYLPAIASSRSPPSRASQKPSASTQGPPDGSDGSTSLDEGEGGRWTPGGSPHFSGGGGGSSGARSS